MVCRGVTAYGGALGASLYHALLAGAGADLAVWDRHLWTSLRHAPVSMMDVMMRMD